MQIQNFKDPQMTIDKLRKKLKKLQKKLEMRENKKEKRGKIIAQLQNENVTQRDEIERLERELRRAGRDREGFLILERKDREDTK